MDEEKVVQQEQVLEKEPVSVEGEQPSEKPKEGEKPKEQPFNEEQEARIQQMLAQASSEATKQATEAGRRQLQSEQDRNRNAEAKAERRARSAESTTKAYETSFKGLDEETQKDIELGRYREQDKYTQSLAQEDAQRQQETAYFQRMNESLLDEVRTWGIDPDDKKIDFASDAPDYFAGRKRFIGSLQKIVGDNQKQAEETQKQNFANLESKLRKDLGLDSVDTTAGSGGGSDSDADFKRGIGDGSLPLNKTNMARAKKLGIA